MSELPICRHRGGEVRAGFVACASNRLVHAEAGVAPISTCLHPCPYADVPNRPEDSTRRTPVESPAALGRCRHLGAVLREESCRLCGGRRVSVPVYRCAVHGACTLRRFNTGKHVASCLTCEEFVEADGERG